MKEYIDREDVKNAIYDLHVDGKRGVEKAKPNTYGADLRDVIREIDLLDEAQNVEEVVYCADCKNVKQTDRGLFCKIFLWKNAEEYDNEVYVDSLDYCIWGTRKLK